MQVSARKFAEVLGVSPQRVHRLLAAGMPHAKPFRRGLSVSIDSVAAIDWLTQREIRKCSAPDGGLSLAQAVLEKAKADARTAAARGIEAENRTMNRAEAVQLIRRLIDIAAQRMTVLPDELGDRLALESEPGVIRDVVFQATRAVRERVSDDFEALARQAQAGDDS